MPTTTGLATSFITFSRPGASGGGATVTDRDGLIKWAGHNLLLASESFDASAWVKASVAITANYAVAPNGTTTADRAVYAGGLGSADSRQVWQGISDTTANKTYTFSVWVWGTGKFRIRNTQGGVVDNYSSNITATSTPTLYTLTVTNGSSAGSSVQSGGVVAATDDSAFDLNIWGAHLYRSDLGSMQLNPAQPAGMQSYYPTTPRNLLGFTEDFSNAAWQKTNVAAFGSGSTANAIVAPNGLQTADKIAYTVSASTDYHGFAQAVSLGSAIYAFSIYAKAAEYSLVYISDANTATFKAAFDLTASSVVAGSTGGAKFVAAAISSVGNGWYRCSVVISNPAGTTYPNVAGYPSGATLDGFGAKFAGDGTSGIYLWGAQLSDSASLDTYVPVYGAAVTSAAYYAPRLDFDPVTLAAKGLLVEEQRSNLATYSDDFSNAAWAKTSGGTGVAPVVTANAATSPDGTSNADLVVFDAGSNGGSDQSLLQGAAFTATAQPYTFSVWLKTSDSSTKTVQLSISGAGALVVTVTGTWQRFSTTWTASAGTWNPRIVVGGGVTSATASLHVYGAQLEAGPFATSYIPTGSATAARAADVASVSTQAFPYSASEGTLVVSYDRVGIKLYSRLFNLGDATENNQVSVLNYSSGQENPYLVTAGTNTVISGPALPAANAVAKMGFAFKSGDNAYSLNGATATANAATFTLAATSLAIGGSQVSGQQINGHIRQITYLPRRISNAELQSRSA